ncbi:MAG TPA: hypothetical protein VEF53_06760 [Patescibacteria group bacterium]|nr:hypothetical protein [Patescibacteria group bacterium]
MYIPAIDTLCATIDIQNYEAVAQDLLSKLETKKNEAKLAATNNASQKTTIKLGNQLFQIYPIGTMGYAYILSNDSYEVKLSQYRSKNENFYPIFIEIRSTQLWSKGVEAAWNDIIQLISENIGKVKANKLNRLDLCCHTDSLELTEEDCTTFEGKFHEDTIYRFRRRVNAMYFGSRKNQRILCRIYDKSFEVKQSNKKLWFHDIWRENGLDIDKVWNVEFEIKREFFKEMQIDSVEDALERINTLWEYCTKEWLIKKNNDRTRIERSTTNEVWVDIQNLFKDYKSRDMIKREKQLEYDAVSLVPGTIGNITSFAARTGIENFEEAMNQLMLQGNKYLFKKDKTYSEVVQEKIALLGQ